MITQCTQDGDDEPDEGCLVDCFFGGEDACDEFTKTVANTATAPIVFPPEPEITLKVPETPPAGGKCPVCKAVGWGDPHIIVSFCKTFTMPLLSIPHWYARFISASDI